MGVSDLGIFVQYSNYADGGDGIWVYDYDTDTWTDKGDGPSGLDTEDGGACYDSESDILIIIERGGSENTQDVWAYDYTDNDWTDYSDRDSDFSGGITGIYYDIDDDVCIML